jgi:hypothetical protein
MELGMGVAFSANGEIPHNPFFSKFRCLMIAFGKDMADLAK